MDQLKLNNNIYNINFDQSVEEDEEEIELDE